MIVQEQRKERLILVFAGSEGEEDALEALDELEQLVETAGGECVGRIRQSRGSADPATYVGRGKLQEIAQLAEAAQADGILCDDELTPAQMRNLGEELDLKIMDRTLLILDVFAARAASSEGKIQVELAQLQHRLTMLSGLGTALSRLGGGIGTRGPGEKKLESDRRLIRGRISRLKAELAEVTKHRQLLREGRKGKALPTAALVGYTNAGKSSLLNALTDADVLQEDRLFATLDPTTRGLILPEGQEILLTDTVGFIRKLPHHLIDAFRNTLEEARYADLILHVVDASSPQAEQQMQVVYETLGALGIKDKPVVTLWNKQDILPEEGQKLRDFRADHAVAVSARTGEGLEDLKALLAQELFRGQIRISRRYAYDQAGKVALIRKYGRLLEEEYLDEGIQVTALVPPQIYGNV